VPEAFGELQKWSQTAEAVLGPLQIALFAVALRMPEALTLAVAKLSARTLILDGEVAIYDQQFRSSFDWATRNGATSPRATPVPMSASSVSCHRKTPQK